MQGLILHCGGQQVERDQLAEVVTPEPSGKHYPIPHDLLVSHVIDQVENAGMQVVGQGHGLTRDGLRYFGMLEVRNGGDYEDRGLLVGIRNSHDKSFSASLAMGTRVFVCDNLSFNGEITLARKHTLNIRRDLSELACRAVGRLGDYRKRLDHQVACYKEETVLDRTFNDLLVTAMESRVIGCTQIPKVLQEWREPQHEEFQPRTMWSAFNAFTEVLKGSADIVRRTQALHGLCDLRAGCAA